MALKVLLADDSVPAQNMGKKILLDAGYEVTTVGNGLEAMRKIKDGLPDIAILDIFMPGYSGLEVCRFLRADDKTAQLPVILTVGKLEPYRPEDGEGVRSNAVLVKPFAAEELTAAVRSLTGAEAADAPTEIETFAKPEAQEAAETEEPSVTLEVSATAEAAATEEASAEEAPAEATAEKPAAKAAAATVGHGTRKDSEQTEEEDEIPVTYQANPELMDTTLNRFSSDRFESGLGEALRFGDDPDSGATESAMFGSGAQPSRFEASVFDTLAPDMAKDDEEGQTSIFSLDQSALNEFEISPEPLLASQGVDTEAGQKSWYASEEIDPEVDYSVTPEALEAEPLALAEDEQEGPVAAVAPPAGEESVPLRTAEPAAEEAEAAATEEVLAAEAAPAAEPLDEVIDPEAPASPEAEELTEEALELAPDEAEPQVVMQDVAQDVPAEEMAQDGGDAVQAEAELAPATPEIEEQAAAEPVTGDAAAVSDEARREAFEALFNSDVPFPLQNESEGDSSEDHSEAGAVVQSLEAPTAEPLELENQPSLEAAELLASDDDMEAEQECVAEDEIAAAPADAFQDGDGDEAEEVASEAAAEVATDIDNEDQVQAFVMPSSDALSEAEPADEPHFYTAEIEEQLLETSTEHGAPAHDDRVERTELVAEVAKVGALLEQMQAMRHAAVEPPASSAMEETAEEEIAPSEGTVEADAAECEQEPAAESSTEEANASLETGSEVEVFLPSPAAAEPEPEAEPEAVLAEALAEDVSALAADSDAEHDGRIQGAVEKVFERFRPLLVDAIAKELRRRD